jgi:hypothetical protein
VSETLDRHSNKIAHLERQVEQLQDALVELHTFVVNPRGYKMGAPRKGPIAGVYRSVKRREADNAE